MPPKVVLLNPSMQTAGYSIITPRWLFVIAEATPRDIVGDPILVDESIEEFNPDILQPGDIVGIGITTGNVAPAYEALRKAKSRGATVIAGGIHPTIFPDEPIEMGADAVVTGNGDVVWSTVVQDAVRGTLRKHYAGGRVPGDGLLKARWDLLDPRHYMFATLQTVAGCPENCSFCSVWVTEGRTPRHRLADKIIEEANELYDRGFRFIVFADDNFNPSTLGRIAREPSPQKRKELEHIRQERLDFFDEYDRRVPKNLYAFTQMTVEAVSDPEYLTAMHDKMRIRGALVGVESFSEEGLKSANKQWNPTGKKMVETIQKIQDAGICVLSSIICGLESDTVETIRTMREFALESGTMLAQFPVYHPYPGTKDFYEMVTDIKNLEKPGYTPKHQTRIPEERFWLKNVNPLDRIHHANISRKDLLTENQKCWNSFYCVRQAWRRVGMGRPGTWPLFGKFTYVMMCLAFRRIYGGQGMAADGVRRKRLGLTTKIIIKLGLSTYNHFYRKELGGRIGKPWAGPAHPSLHPSAQASVQPSAETPVAPN
ncbi:MAG: radical SAM protein [Candidatus Acidiferrales bacterium]